jgi:hypothetical protein
MSTLPVKTPQEHQESFLTQAENLDIDTTTKTTTFPQRCKNASPLQHSDFHAPLPLED